MSQADSSFQGEDIYYDYAPQVECVVNNLDDLPDPSNCDDDDDDDNDDNDTTWSELPKPPIMDSYEEPGTVIMMYSNNTDEEEQQQQQNTSQHDPRDTSIASKSSQTNRRRRLLYLALFCLLLVGVVALSTLVWGVRKIRKEQQQQEDSSTLGRDGTSEDNVFLGASLAPSLSPSSNSRPTTVSPVPTKSPTAAPFTNAPTRTPTSFPTAPTSTPTEAPCRDRIQADLFCYSPDTTINISFENCEPELDDWIGIYPNDAGLDWENLGDPVMWLWNCGSQDCLGRVYTDTLPFGGDLTPGGYLAHMIRRNSGGPYSSYASSPPFFISEDCPQG